jgi:hypothetical protein
MITVASIGDKTVSEVDGGDRKKLPTTIQLSSYGNHDLLMSGGHDDNVRGLLDSSKQLREAAAQLEEMYLNTIDSFKMKGECK